MTATDRPRLKLDHFAVLARTLEEGVAHVEKCLGVTVPFGGAHPMMGTHNCLARLADDVFLEIIAIDPAADHPGRPRWFALDEWDEAPRLAVYVVQTPSIAQSLADPALAPAGEAIEARRGALSWQISVPSDGRPGYDGAFPSLIEWRADEHPAARMADVGCRLVSFDIEHPQASEIEAALTPAFADARVTLGDAASVRLTARIETPTGLRMLV